MDPIHKFNRSLKPCDESSLIAVLLLYVEILHIMDFY